MRWLLLLVVTLSTATVASAASPRLDQLAPQGAQRGTEAVISLRGPRLGMDPLEILWHEPGIEVKALERVDDNQTKATVFVPETTQPGRYPLRLRTKTGISNVRTLHVGALPESNETEPNSDPNAPQAIEFGTVVNGLIQREDIDYFTFEVKAGEVIAVEVDGLRLGRTFFDPVITLYGPDGAELAKCDDWPLVKQDACLSLVAPSDGKYLLELRESAYRGDGNCTYRLHVGNFPRPLAVYPPGGRVGETVNIEWLGDAAGTASQEVQLPDVPTDALPYVPNDQRGWAPSPHMLRVVDMPVAGEVEPNNKPQEATAGEAPGAFYGRLNEPGERDHFRFAAKKGQVLHIRAHARRIGSPADMVMRVLDANGKSLAGNDDDRGYPDSYIRFQAPEDGDYIIQVEERLRRADDANIYWIEALAPVPTVELTIDEQERYIAKLLDVPQGNRNGGVLRVGRRDTGGAMAIDWSQLPAGVSVEIPELRGDFDRVPFVVSAAEDAPLGQSLSVLTAKRTDDDVPVVAAFKQTNWMVRGQNNVDMWNFNGTRPVVAVTEKAPFSIRIEQPKCPLVQRGNKDLKIVAERAEGFEGAILVRMLYNPPGVSSNNSRRVTQKENEAIIPITANQNARTGEWPIVVRGEAEVNGKLVTVTPLATLTVAEPYVAMELPRPNVVQGGTLNFPITIEQRTPFEGEAKVELINLPPGVTTEPIMITKETTEIAFELKVADDARPGQHKGQFCRVTVMENGEPVIHSVGYGELRVDKPLPPPTEATASK
ncbi:pre-peptidase C-terminal domain-containing protein [Aeoliella sp.]|uniref:pre-peptidase C-terminal domain-containing protein n=1 Tax=Aeoliella sp. TaxID=2795800 RepID=UPI003CCBBEA7